MIARAVQYLYDASASDSTATHLIRGTFCEIYNEQARRSPPPRQSTKPPKRPNQVRSERRAARTGRQLLKE